jgi:hypothetical protein
MQFTRPCGFNLCICVTTTSSGFFLLQNSLQLDSVQELLYASCLTRGKLTHAISMLHMWVAYVGLHMWGCICGLHRVWSGLFMSADRVYKCIVTCMHARHYMHTTLQTRS